jgi:hypothetical protein
VRVSDRGGACGVDDGSGTTKKVDPKKQAKLEKFQAKQAKQAVAAAAPAPAAATAAGTADAVCGEHYTER